MERFQDFSILPMCVLKDEFKNGVRTGTVSFNDVFKPSHKILPRMLGGEYVFTKYHFHDGVEILLVEEGEATAVINNVPYRVRSGDLVISNPYEAHGLYLDSSDIEFKRSCIIFNPRDIFPLSKSETVFDRLRNLRFKNYIQRCTDPSLALCIDKMIKIAEQKSASATVEEISTLTEFYAKSIKAGIISDVGSDTPYRREFVTEITDYVEEHLTECITTDSAAEYCKYSAEHFCRLFKACFGTTFRDYVNSCRIKLSKDKIDRGETYKIGELSQATGYSNPNYFSSLFRKIIGIAPSKYIEKVRKQNEVRAVRFGK